MRNYAERNDCQLSRYGDFRSETEGEGGGGGGGGTRYPDFPYLVYLLLCGRVVSTHMPVSELLYFFFFFFLFSFNFIYEVSEHISVPFEKRERDKQRERESKGAWRCD